MQLSTERLLIREFVPGDRDDVHEYASDPAVVRFMSWGPNTPEDTSQFFVRRIASQTANPRVEFELAVVWKPENKVVGGVGVRIKSATHREGDIGYVLNRRYWNRGIITEASNAMLDFGFGELGLHRIYATCDPENRPSARVMEKLGMKYEGRMRQNLFEKGHWRDTLLYAVLESDPR